MEKQTEMISLRRNHFSSSLFRAGAVFFSTITFNLLLRDLAWFALAAEDTENDKEKRNSLDVQQSSSIINFVQQSKLPISGTPTDIEVQGNYAFIATKDVGMLIVDVNIMSNPVLVGTYNTTYDINGTVYPIHEMFVRGNFAFLAEDRGGITYS